MKCQECLNEFNISDLKNRKVKFCPFCGKMMITKENPTEFSDIVECLKFIFEKYTVKIITDSKKVLAIISDYMPKLEVEKRILKVALESGLYKELIDENGAIISLSINKVKHKLENDYGLSDKWANEAVSWIVKSLSNETQEPISNNDSTVVLEKRETKHVDKLAELKKSLDQPSERKVVIPKGENTITGRDSRGEYTYVGSVDFSGKPAGTGAITYANGEMFIGNFSYSGKLEGMGKWIMRNGDTFEGMFKDGKPVEGHGILTKSNGDQFVGNFRKGLRMHGDILVTKAGESVPYKTPYENGHPKFEI